MITPKNLIQHEIIGLKAQVAESSNTLSVGISGKVVDETTHTLVIEKGVEEKRVFKKASKLIFQLPTGKKIEVDGTLLEGKPWNRVKK